MARERNERAGWIAIPSVPPERAAQAFASFYLAVAAAVAIDVLLIMHNQRPATWQLTAEMVFDDGSQILAWALAATWPIMEAMRMVLARIWEDRTRREAREEGIAIGKEEGIEEGIEIGEERSNQRWREWVQRRDLAEARGEPFDEPMPDISGNGSGKSS